MVKNTSLTPAIHTLLFFTLLFGGLYFAKPFLVPICLAWLLALLLVPVSGFLESKGWNRGLSTFASVLLFLIVIGGVGTLISLQLKGLAKDTSQIEVSIKKNIEKTQKSIKSYLGVPPEKQEKMVKKQAKSAGTGKAAGTAMKIAGGVLGILGNFVIVTVYIFLFLFFRGHFRKFILKAVPPTDKTVAEKIMGQTATSIQKYLAGMAKMIVCLWIMYSIGFSIAGVKYAIFFAMLCGLLEIVPFVGNLIGTALTVLMALTQGNTGVVIGVIATYAVVQFVQTYFLEPLVVGKGVNINPVFTILIIVLGELVWGIAGMVLFLPLLAIVKIVCDNIPALQPYGFLIGNSKNDNGKHG